MGLTANIIIISPTIFHSPDDLCTERLYSPLTQHVTVMQCATIGLCKCFTSPPIQYRLYGRRFLQVERPNQQYQSTEGESCKGKQSKKHEGNTNYTYVYTQKIAYTNKHSKSLSLQLYGVTRGRLPQRAGLLGLNGGGAAAAVPPKPITSSKPKDSV